MTNRKAALFRLYPTPEQTVQMAQIAGACRFVYNLALEQRRDWYRPGRKFNFASQCRDTSQTCPVCGHVSAANRQNQADFVCVACGHAANADTNAAINILRRADSALKPVEEHRATGPMKQEPAGGKPHDF